MKLFSTIIMGLLLLGMGGQAAVGSEEKIMDKKTIDTPDGTRNAVFAGGCFWCTESDFENLPGVLMVVSGYTGGTLANPTYEQVSAGGTGHVEAIQVVYEPDKVSFEQLLEIFWRGVDPTDNGGQFVDRGAQYRSAIFYADEEERKTAEKSRQALVDSGRFSKPVVTEILPLGPFYPAEEYHQDYYLKNPLRYQWYRSGSGRDQFLREVWGPESSKPESSKPATSK